MFGDAPRIEGKGGLADKWLIPPFSVLDAKSGVWQKRKGEWLRIFQIVSELGRGEDASPGGSARPSATLGIDGKTVGGDGAGKAFAKMTNIADWTNEQDNLSAPETGTSIFDPFLCQLMYLWFCPPGGLILDPFAGGHLAPLPVPGDVALAAAGPGRGQLGVDEVEPLAQGALVLPERLRAGVDCSGEYGHGRWDPWSGRFRVDRVALPRPTWEE